VLEHILQGFTDRLVSLNLTKLVALGKIPHLNYWFTHRSLLIRYNTSCIALSAELYPFLPLSQIANSFRH